MENIEIKEDMKVIGSDGGYVGTVDKVEGDQIKLTKNDSPNGQHNYLSTSSVSSVEGDTVTLSKPAEKAKAEFGAGDGIRQKVQTADGARY